MRETYWAYLISLLPHGHLSCISLCIPLALHLYITCTSQAPHAHLTALGQAEQQQADRGALVKELKLLDELLTRQVLSLDGVESGGLQVRTHWWPHYWL